MTYTCFNSNVVILFLLKADHAQFMCNTYLVKGLNWSSNEYGFNEVELFTCMWIIDEHA